MLRVVVVLLLMLSLPCPGAFAQSEPGDSVVEASPAVSVEDFAKMGVDELRIRLVPLTREQLETATRDAMEVVRARAGELSTLIVTRMRSTAGDDAAASDAPPANTRIDVELRETRELVARVNVILAALEEKGGDVADAKAYLAALSTLDADTGQPATKKPSEPQTDEARARAQASDLVGLIRAEPPAHEREVPWEVPLSEFELELQPLPVETILERLGKWQAMLQREVRKRVRIDILLNDGEKLEAARQKRRRAMGAAADVPVEALEAELATRSQEQQQIVNAIVARMEIAIKLAKMRGGDTTPFSQYMAAATGQKLNLTDLTVLRAQVAAWLQSSEGGVRIGLSILKFLGIVLAFWILSRLLGRITGAALKRTPRASSLLRPVLVGLVRRVTFFIGLVVGVSMLGVNIGPLVAMIGAAGLVIGLALQGTLSNFASGILILLNRPFDVGHVIEAGGVLGKVESMSLMSTTILTFDNKVMIVPNNQVWNGVITNISGKSTRRVDLVFGIGYTDDMNRAIELIREVISNHPKVNSSPEPTIKVNELADNSVNIIARPWASTTDYWDVYWDLTHEVKARFDAEGINIPFPQRDVNLPGPIEVKLLAETRAAAAPQVETFSTST